VLAQSSLIYVALRLTAEHVEVEAPEPIRSRWVPTSTTRPWSITAILSACLAGAGGGSRSAPSCLPLFVSGSSGCRARPSRPGRPTWVREKRCIRCILRYWCLLREDLLDELQLFVHPVLIGSGKRLFEEGEQQKALELVDSKTFSTGVV
jgi:hypothetical protein